MKNNKPYIICVDDEVSMLHALRRGLKNVFDIQIFSDPLEAYSFCEKEGGDIDVIISDIKMPKLNGYRFIKDIKNKFPDIECIVHTGFTMDNKLIIEAINDKLIHKYLEKPTTIDAVIDAVDSALEVKFNKKNCSLLCDSIKNLPFEKIDSETLTSLAETGFYASSFLHDISNDALSISSLTYILNNEKSANQEIRDISRLLGSISENIISTMEELRYFMNKGKHLFVKDKTNVNIFLEKLLPDLKNYFYEGSVLKNDLPEQLIVSLDKNKFRRVVKNIAKNAAESIGNEKGVFIISYDEEHEEILFSDNGNAPSIEKLNKIFDPFSSNKKKGLGLGLTNVREIVKLHGWEINARKSERLSGIDVVISLKDKR